MFLIDYQMNRWVLDWSKKKVTFVRNKIKF